VWPAQVYLKTAASAKKENRDGRPLALEERRLLSQGTIGLGSTRDIGRNGKMKVPRLWSKSKAIREGNRFCAKKVRADVGGDDSIRGANVMERGQQLCTTGSGDQSLISQNRGRTEETSICIGGNLGIQADSKGPVRRMGYSSLLYHFPWACSPWTVLVATYSVQGLGKPINFYVR
jgi:hypothetical protein